MVTVESLLSGSLAGAERPERMPVLNPGLVLDRNAEAASPPGGEGIVSVPEQPDGGEPGGTAMETNKNAERSSTPPKGAPGRNK